MQKKDILGKSQRGHVMNPWSGVVNEFTFLQVAFHVPVPLRLNGLIQYTFFFLIDQRCFGRLTAQTE